jgi:hypothetical protein
VFSAQTHVSKEPANIRFLGEFIPNPDKDLRRKTTGAREAGFRISLPNKDFGRGAEFHPQKYGFTK